MDVARAKRIGVTHSVNATGFLFADGGVTAPSRSSSKLPQWSAWENSESYEVKIAPKGLSKAQRKSENFMLPLRGSAFPFFRRALESRGLR